MFLQNLEIQQFRCFQNKKLTFKSPITLITGDNGAGKTSIIEAIYYLSYFKSFRSHVLSDLMYAGSDSFFLKGTFIQEKTQELHDLQVGYSQKKKAIKFDQKPVSSHKQVLALFPVVTLTEDDTDLIKGYPSGRRAFIDQAVLLEKPLLLDLYREFRQVLYNRNALLEQNNNTIDILELEIWTQKLWEISTKIQQSRQEVMGKIQIMVNQLIDQFFDGIYQVELRYDAKHVDFDLSPEVFRAKMQQISHQERVFKRSMFGAHLDDIIFQIRGKKARIFASRGQQKLISLLCKVSLALIECDNQTQPLLLIDDFISDFDQIRLKNLINFFLSCKNQIIMTTPTLDPELQKLLEKADLQVL